MKSNTLDGKYLVIDVKTGKPIETCFVIRLNNKEFKEKLLQITSSYVDNECNKPESERNYDVLNMAYEIEMLILDWKVG